MCESIILAASFSWGWAIALFIAGIVLFASGVDKKKGGDGRMVLGFFMGSAAVLWLVVAILAIPYNWLFGGEETVEDEGSDGTEVEVVDGGSNSGYVASATPDDSGPKEEHTPIWDVVKPGSQNHAGGELEKTLLAARTGNANAQMQMGVKYRDGDGVPQDHSQAKEWFLKAAKNGEPGGAFYLGLMYSEGEGVEKDMYQAAQWYLAAAKEGAKEAQFNLALILWDGRGVQQDKKEGLRWMRRAAIQGMRDAQYNMGIFLGGSFGVVPNRALAMAWLAVADKNNHPRAKGKMESIILLMTPAERDNSVTLARGLIAEIQQDRFR